MESRFDPPQKQTTVTIVSGGGGHGAISIEIDSTISNKNIFNKIHLLFSGKKYTHLKNKERD